MSNPPNKPKATEPAPFSVSQAESYEEYLRGMAEMKDIGTTFRLDSTFRRWLRDYLYDTVRLCTDVCWKVVRVEGTADPTGSSFGSKQDVLFLAMNLLRTLTPNLIDLFRFYQSLNRGRLEGFGGTPNE